MATKAPEPAYSQDPPGLLQFMILGDLDHAARHLQESWSDRATAPSIQPRSTHHLLTIEFTTPSIRRMQTILGDAIRLGEPLARSARALRMLLATKLAERRIPEENEDARNLGFLIEAESERNITP